LVIKGLRPMQNVISKPVINKALKLQIYTTSRPRIIGLSALRHNFKPLYFVKYPRAVVGENENKNNLVKKKVLLKVDWGIEFL